MACFLVPMVLGIFTTILRNRFPESYRINVLNLLLWGGVAALAFEHVFHGEIVPYPPFLTAGLSEVLPEMLIVGVPMALAATGMWASMLLITKRVAGRTFRLSRLGVVELPARSR